MKKKDEWIIITFDLGSIPTEDVLLMWCVVFMIISLMNHSVLVRIEFAAQEDFIVKCTMILKSLYEEKEIKEKSVLNMISNVKEI